LKKAIIREFQEKDAEDVVEIFQTYGMVHDEDEKKRTLDLLRKIGREPKWYAHHLVAELDGGVVGRAVLEAPYPPYSELINLYVRPEYCGMGVGSGLVQNCIDLASTMGSLLMLSMTDPVGNLPAHRLYSKFGFRPGILGDPTIERGHTWVFRFSEKSCVSEFLKRHPFAEPSVSRSKVDFHGRMLYNMAWCDPQTEEELSFFVEGQPSQTPEGTMPRIAGFSYEENSAKFDLLVRDQDRVIRQGETSRFAVSIWNFGPETLRIAYSVSVPDGTELVVVSPVAPSFEVAPDEVEHMQFRLTWLSGFSLPDFTSFSTVPATCFFAVGGFERPLFASAGFERAQGT